MKARLPEVMLGWAGPSGSLPNTKPHFSQEWITLVVCSQDCQPIFKLLIVVLHFIYQFEESDRKIIMAGRLSHVASQIMGGNGVVGRSVASSLRLRSGMGLPVGKHIVPDKPVSCNFSLSLNVQITSYRMVSISNQCDF